jgi:hypothetical protein
LSQDYGENILSVIERNPPNREASDRRLNYRRRWHGFASVLGPRDLAQ